MRKIYVQFCENFMPLLIAVAIAVTLINNKSLGDQHLIAYICYFLVSSIIGIIVFFNWLLIKDTKKNYFPVYILIFIILSAYIFIKAEQTGIFVLKQYYWIASAIFFVSIQLAVSIIKNGKNANQFFSFRKTILLLISFLAIFDSIIVLLQFIGIITLKGNIFKCTGTWAHPNVTAMFLSMSVFCFFICVNQRPPKLRL